jgi:hypothetical protein
MRSGFIQTRIANVRPPDVGAACPTALSFADDARQASVIWLGPVLRRT